MNNALTTGIELSYLLAAILFIIGLKQLSSPATARQGNFLAAIGMLIAIIATLINQEILSYGLIAVALVIGSIIGLVSAQKVPMTAMPQMVGIFNGLGGAASALIAIGEYWRLLQSGENIAFDSILIAILGVLIGGVTFTGSVLAFAKLQELITGAPVTFPFQQPFNILLLLTFLGGSVYLFFDPTSIDVFLTLVVLSLIFGALFVLPIGGGDMPVVISLLNSFSGIAASVVGFILMNSMLIIAGALVGASGIILTQIMCKAMNRSLASVLFGAFGTGASAGGKASATSSLDKSVHAIDSEEGAMMLGYARSVVIVPGYGMAVAQAQHAVRELAEQLEKNGVEVKYAIHPVAGRMPGHMNVLLAEANVPYPQLYDMDDINPEFERVDVALIIGANDVVNPAARHDKASPIYGMPILDVDKAQHTIVIKRSMRSGFAGVENELFYNPKTFMLFGSAQDVVAQLVSQVKDLS
ncbi:MAG: NAD(P)(+) transhydrogenase (Re/Si-specific) subunit beta [Microcystis aeruginosa Ma_QC_Ch_20071001_S25]|jgi:NAD(P) transhydrogenase subunit beta|uniref:NAD(P) transhydrogenase subunit beta n=3 Tax=Microcystis aeruginosa TaxID=1126 RepID=A0A552F727_MICAE|nr:MULTISPECIES: NAD(P)(+) transhydrogenase (Re/Si-specific) subunit beta [unclassified Microcystis]MCA2762707.1 NAD(P)(+) transhydrogenase (Re/Si-specific) subunit beta [Microcystis sp. M151S2]MCA2928767.1 NAD(P)(+) transhydrogenase (Re/Si-specific) subunit beta [Microcystis sp. M020S1]MCA2936332.1 NAD(P)(+) transhydrogenase (Re/Si-specific) subunit beta [Microcystis sp. M015S1]MCU7246080.1 NAD(P)(+) transhydrogenase (Re/Si-specific) subunit beta [Microcystis aeruginosa WS75]NCQ71198.1 NAD(P)